MKRVRKSSDSKPVPFEMRRIGRSGLKHNGGFIAEEFLRDLHGFKAMRVYREMFDNEPSLAAVYWLLETFISQVTFNITPSDAERQSSLDIASFVFECMHDMEHSWQRIPQESMTAVKFGHAPQEIIYKTREGENEDPSRRSKFSDGRIGWRRFSLRAQDSIYRWKMANEYDPVNGDPDVAIAFEQLLNSGGGSSAEVPLSKCFHFRIRDHLDNPEGQSLGRPCYPSWYALKNIEYFESVGIERDTAGLLVMEVPPTMVTVGASSTDTATLDALMDQLGQVHSGERAALAIPSEDIGNQKSGFKFRVERGAGSRTIDTDVVIRRKRSDMLRAFLADFLVLGHDSVGSKSLVESRTDTFILALEMILDKFCGDFTAQAIVPLMRFNAVPREDWPTMTHGQIVGPTPEVVAAFISTMISCGVLTPGPEIEAFTRSIGGLPQLSGDSRG